MTALRDAGVAFPAGTGLGWDDLHPRALLRLPNDVLEALLRVLHACESQGRWPKAVASVIIALLPKPDGGRHPIGFFPLLPRVWMKARREMAREWGRLHERSYLYAGVGKGATVAAWKPAACGELAATVPGAAYGQALFDLVKAFDRVPHHILVREAQALGYSLWVLRLSLAACQLGRVLWLEVISNVVYAFRGITAGSGLATTEMHILLLRIVDAACRLYPAVTPTLFVDDLSAEAAGTERYLIRNVVPFVRYVCNRMQEDLLEISQRKPVCIASTDALGRSLAATWRKYGIRYVRRVKSLGTGLGAGARRNVQVAKMRYSVFRKRVPRFRRLRTAGVSGARLLRTGGNAAMTFGEAVMGVSLSQLLQQRRAAAAAAAPTNGCCCCQSLDLALILADESPRGKADPTFAAHLCPIGEWAQAVWEGLLPMVVLQRLISSAPLRLMSAARPWAVARGPGAAVTATAWRLRWDILDARRIVTDTGRELLLDIDPPIVVARECAAAVRRWRWPLVEQAEPSLASQGKGFGANFTLVLQLLQPRATSFERTPDHQGALRSAVLRRQWPKSRCFAAVFVEHNRCFPCLDVMLSSRGALAWNELALDDLVVVPICSLLRRICSCPAHREARLRHAPDAICT